MNKIIRPEPIWVKNPKTGKEVNVEPIFRLINEGFFGGMNTTKELENRVSDVIEYIGTETVSAEFNNTEITMEDLQKIQIRQVSVLYNLHELKDMFELMKEQ
jgi:hypothetical protein